MSGYNKYPKYGDARVDRTWSPAPGLTPEEEQAASLDQYIHVLAVLCERYGIDPNRPDAPHLALTKHAERSIPGLRRSRSIAPVWTPERRAQLVEDIDALRHRPGSLSPHSVAQAARMLTARPEYAGHTYRTLCNVYHQTKARS